MPWNVKKVSDEFCVFTEDGKKLKCYKTSKEADDYKKALYANVEEKLSSLESIQLEHNGPVILGIAATNRPHLPLPPMSVVDVEGRKLIRVPFLRAGIFSHPEHGNLVFNDTVLAKMLDNYTNGKSHFGVSLDIRHKPELGALAWFDKDKGGDLVLETDEKYGKLLVGYAEPTSEEALKIVEKKQYAYASAEFKSNHKDTMIAKLSTDDLKEITIEDLFDENTKLEEPMEQITVSLEEYNELKQKAESLTATETALEEARKELKKFEKPQAPAVSEEVRVKLEEQDGEIKRLKRDALEREVDLVVTKAQAYRDSNDYGHSPILLEIARNAMLGLAVPVKDGSIKLESDNPADVVDFFRKTFVHMLESIPGQVRMESKTVGDETKSFNKGSDEFETKDFESFWSERM